MDSAAELTAAAAPSTRPPTRRAQYPASGTESTRAMISPRTTISRVIGRPWPIALMTGSLVMTDWPRLPCTALSSQCQYCCGNDPFRPSCLSRATWSARVAVVPSMISAGSPGMSCSSPETPTVTSSRTPIRCAILCTMYLVTSARLARVADLVEHEQLVAWVDRVDAGQVLREDEVVVGLPVQPERQVLHPQLLHRRVGRLAGRQAERGLPARKRRVHLRCPVSGQVEFSVGVQPVVERRHRVAEEHGPRVEGQLEVMVHAHRGRRLRDRDDLDADLEPRYG